MKPTPRRTVSALTRLLPVSRNLFSVSCLLFTVSLLFLARPSYAQWAATYGGGGKDVVYSIQQTADGGYIVAGFTWSFGAGSYDFWVLRLDADGSIDPSCNFIGDTGITGVDSNATIMNSNVSVRDSNATVRTPSPTIQDTGISANVLCQSPPVEDCTNGIDDDGDGLVDCLDPACFVVVDGDGVSASPCGNDCNDADPSIYPLAPELCDGKDNDCDDLIDEGGVCCTDGDSDGYFLQAGCGTSIDCNDNDPSVFPGRQEVCDNKDNNCDGQVDEGGVCCTDSDGDTYYAQADCGTPVDCNDKDFSVNPGVSEICDGKDNNCDGQVDDGGVCCTDGDSDGYFVQADCGPVDCDDSNDSVNPGAIEICDSRDNNCDGLVDEGRVCCTDSDGDTYYAQADCGSPVDCDDSDASVSPGEIEVCDNEDNNCDGLIDEGGVCCTDNDEDGYFVQAGCGTPVDCDDNDSSINPGELEVCDGQDNNCDGQVDEGEVCCTDSDRDGCYAQADCGTPVDCDDSDASRYPGAQERCDGKDNNCDGQIDEGGVCWTTIQVTIGVKPGSFPNSINLRNKGNVPVAIFGSATFDATTINRNTVVFAGASALSIGGSPEDVNNDGIMDVVLHFKTQDLNLQTTDTEACLSGRTMGGQEFKGCDSVRIVK